MSFWRFSATSNHEHGDVWYPPYFQGLYTHPMQILRTITWLAPGLPIRLFERVCESLETELDIPVSLESRTKLSGPAIGSLDPFAENRADLGFLCGPAAVPSAVRTAGGFELLGLAPLFDDPRYAGKPTCFCDLVVRDDCDIGGLDDLQNKAFGYNDTSSLSGWLGLASALQQRGTRIPTFFASVTETGGHIASLRAVRAGSIDVASIDSNVLRTHPGILDGLRVVDSVGPWPSQPVVVRSTLSQQMKTKVKMTLTRCGPWMDIGFVGFRPQSYKDLDAVPSAKTGKS